MKSNITLKAAVFALLCVAALTVRAAEPKELWEKNCASCHGKDGKGETKMGKKAGVKDYTDPKVLEAIKDDKAFKSVKEGMKEGGKELMKPFAEKLTDAEIKSLVAYMKTFKK